MYIQEPFVSNLRGKARNSDEGCLLQSDFFKLTDQGEAQRGNRAKSVTNQGEDQQKTWVKLGDIPD
jgi:hypothetical protein